MRRSRAIRSCPATMQSVLCDEEEPGDQVLPGDDAAGVTAQSRSGDADVRRGRKGAGNQPQRLSNRYSVAVSGQPQTGEIVRRVRVTNLPNMLTLLRLLLVPLFVLVLFAGDGHETVSRITAFVIFAVAVITDRFDGALARTYGMVTKFGTLADPIVDKTLI